MADHSLDFKGRTVRKVVCDSRLADDTSLFVAIAGAVVDGHDFVSKAYENGCRCFVLGREVELADDCVYEIADDTHIALAEYASELYAFPSRRMCMIGITGTKGKSTVASLVYQLLTAFGKKAMLMGTTGIYLPDGRRKTNNTTPSSEIIQKTLSDAVEQGCEYAVMEVSSQAYLQNRVYGIKYDYALFTNLYPDHISEVEHKDYENYRYCKGLLFANSQHGIINADDGECDYFTSASNGEVCHYSRAELSNIVSDGSGLEFDYGDTHFSSMLCGSFNLSNLLCAIKLCEKLGFPLSEIAAKVACANGADGRFERVANIKGRTFIIDYAHNGVSLQSTLEVLRELKPKRLVCLFGAIGGRAFLRREELARACAQYADLGIITTDNPDYEQPEKIISDVESYMKDFPHICITDREEAIDHAVKNSLEGDIVLFAGKGHEDYQIIRGEHVPFNEKEIVKKTIEKYFGENNI